MPMPKLVPKPESLLSNKAEMDELASLAGVAAAWVELSVVGFLWIGPCKLFIGARSSVLLLTGFCGCEKSGFCKPIPHTRT